MFWSLILLEFVIYHAKRRTSLEFGACYLEFFSDGSPLENSANSVTVSIWYSHLFKKLIIIVHTNRREIGEGVSGIF